jgi:hypothetical protein
VCVCVHVCVGTLSPVPEAVAGAGVQLIFRRCARAVVRAWETANTRPWCLERCKRMCPHLLHALAGRPCAYVFVTKWRGGGEETLGITARCGLPSENYHLPMMTTACSDKRVAHQIRRRGSLVRVRNKALGGKIDCEGARC